MSKEDNLQCFFDLLSEELASIPKRDQAFDYAVQRQMQRARKRARFNVNGLADKAVSAFLDTNLVCKFIKPNIDKQILADAKYFILNLLERYTKYLDPESIQQTLSLDHMLEFWRFGPGASNGIRGTHTAVKITQHMTCTARSESLVRKLRASNIYMTLNDERTQNGTSLISGSRLTTVPKNEDTMRTIAIEPSGNMALQLAAGTYLEGALRSIGLDISTQQPKNKAAACRGSLSNGLATIDLKSASDMITIQLVRALLPAEWFDLLMAIRSPVIELPNGEMVDLNMISTMGNGFTFPLMTLIIVALIYGFRAQRGGPNLYIDWTDTCVFGDDIIIPSSEYEDFVDVLTSAGLIVNCDKSYSVGPFRESCGGDYYLGIDVTPVYIKSLATVPETYVAINQLLGWCGKHNVFLYRSLKFLMSLLGNKVFLVPEWYNPDQGLLTSQCSRRFSYLSIKQKSIPFGDSIYALMLCIGGYLNESGPAQHDVSVSKLTYTPRSNRPRYVVRKARLPKGILDGGDPLTRSPKVTARISGFVQVLML